MIKANNPNLKSWVAVPTDSDFPIQNLPLGIFKTDSLAPRVGVRIGDSILDLKTLHVLGYLDNLPFTLDVLDAQTLNGLMKKGKLACRRLRDRISDLLNKEFSSNIFIKAENLQKIGAFKFRGAINSILKLDDNKKDVLAWSSGNHAQAIASACYLTNKKATIVMPEDSPNTKLNGTKSWGANIVTFDRYSESREKIGTNLAKKINAEIIPPFDHPDVINGQGTVGYEIINDCKKII